MVEASHPDSGPEEEYKDEDGGGPRDSIAVADAALFEEQGETAALFNDESVAGFTVRNP